MGPGVGDGRSILEIFNGRVDNLNPQPLSVCLIAVGISELCSFKLGSYGVGSMACCHYSHLR